MEDNIFALHYYDDVFSQIPTVFKSFMCGFSGESEISDSQQPRCIANAGLCCVSKLPRKPWEVLHNHEEMVMTLSCAGVRCRNCSFELPTATHNVSWFFLFVLLHFWDPVIIETRSFLRRISQREDFDYGRFFYILRANVYLGFFEMQHFQCWVSSAPVEPRTTWTRSAVQQLGF